MKQPSSKALLPAGDRIDLMRLEDLEAVYRLECACQKDPWTRQHFIDELNNPVAVVDLYWRRDVIAGFLCTWMVAGEMQIQNIATSPDMRRQGVAKRLMFHAIDRCGDELESVCLEVRASNIQAVTLYKECGFIVSGTRPGYYPDGEDALLMTYTR